MNSSGDVADSVNSNEIFGLVTIGSWMYIFLVKSGVETLNSPIRAGISANAFLVRVCVVILDFFQNIFI